MPKLPKGYRLLEYGEIILPTDLFTWESQALYDNINTWHKLLPTDRSIGNPWDGNRIAPMIRYVGTPKGNKTCNWK